MDVADYFVASPGGILLGKPYDLGNHLDWLLRASAFFDVISRERYDFIVAEIEAKMRNFGFAPEDCPEGEEGDG